MYVQVPEITNYTMVNRTYRYFQGVPLFPFGYGLYVLALVSDFNLSGHYFTAHTLRFNTLI